MVCTFFGHRDCYGFDKNVLYCAIEELIQNGVDEFYVGHQGHFDSLVLACLKMLKHNYRHISYSVVLAYLPTPNSNYYLYQDCSIYPDGLELSPPRFAIERRNRWLISKAQYCICYINNTWGGAYKFVKQAKSKGLTIINLGSLKI